VTVVEHLITLCDGAIEVEPAELGCGVVEHEQPFAIRCPIDRIFRKRVGGDALGVPALGWNDVNRPATLLPTADFMGGIGNQVPVRRKAGVDLVALTLGDAGFQ